jgi:hypothetical protein
MLGHALLTVIAADSRTDHPGPVEMIALTCAEVRCLITALILEPARAVACPLTWSRWRRRHQHRARISHHQRRPAAWQHL